MHGDEYISYVLTTAAKTKGSNSIANIISPLFLRYFDGVSNVCLLHLVVIDLFTLNLHQIGNFLSLSLALLFIAAQSFSILYPPPYLFALIHCCTLFACYTRIKDNVYRAHSSAYIQSDRLQSCNLETYESPTFLIALPVTPYPHFSRIHSQRPYQICVWQTGLNCLMFSTYSDYSS